MAQPNNLHPKLERLDGLQDKNGEYLREEFSHSRCECCGDLPGERYIVRAHYWNKRAKNGSSMMRGKFSVCPQCIYDWQ
jgi:hypothetical protein